jgi:hypothetical protein
MTLTLRGRKNAHLPDVLKRLRESFAELRESALWQNAVVGGAAFLEIKHVGHWHPHLHLIVEGTYIDQKRLSAAWFAITGDSFVVDVRAVDNGGARLRYVAKYASKPLDATVTKTPKILDAAMCALKGTRLISSFGSWYGAITDDEPLDAIDAMLGGQRVWRQVGSLPDVWRRAINGDVSCIGILSALRKTVTLASNPQPPPDHDTLTDAAAYALF